MRAILLSLTLVLMSLTFAPAPASADFHPVCTGVATGYANVELLADYSEAGVLDFHGRVNCPDAVVTITLLQLYDASGDDLVLLDEIENNEGCESSLTSETCTLRGTYPSSAGTYEVRMLFDVDDPATAETDYEDVPRHAVFEYLGDGQPVPTCTSVGFFPVYAPPEC